MKTFIPYFLRDTKGCVGCEIPGGYIIDPPVYIPKTGKWNALANIHDTLAIVELTLRFHDDQA